MTDYGSSDLLHAGHRRRDPQELRRAQEYLGKQILSWQRLFGLPDAELLVRATKKLWAGERSLVALTTAMGMAHGGVSARVMEHVLRLVTTDVAAAEQKAIAAENAALRKHERLLRVVALVAVQPPGEETSADQGKVMQMLADLEDPEAGEYLHATCSCTMPCLRCRRLISPLSLMITGGHRILDSVLMIFCGEYTQGGASMITRGLDPLDAALVRRILQYMDVGLDAMQSDPDWPKVAELAVAAISAHYGNGNAGGGNAGDGGGVAPGSSGFFECLESGPIIADAVRRQPLSAAGVRAFREKTAIGVFFSGHWCPPSRSFTPDLCDAYDRWAAQKGFEIVFVSSDHSEEEFWDYFGEMPWKSIPFGDPRGDALSQRYHVSGIPTLVLVVRRRSCSTNLLA